MFHEYATMNTNLQDSKMTLPSNTLQFEVENHPSHHSQDDLDETNDQEDDQPTPKSHSPTRDVQLIDQQSPDTTVDRMSQSRNDQGQSNQPTRVSSPQGGNLSEYQLARDRSRREIKKPSVFCSRRPYYICLEHC